MKSKGFTLIELMVVMGIIGLLATLALPGYQSYRVKANNVAAVSEVHLIHLVELAFYDNNSVYADYTVGDISAHGAVNKIITINGTGHSFVLPNLNVAVDSLVKTNAAGQYATIAVRANGGDVIIAMELEQSATLREKITPSLTSGDIPSPTEVIDLVAGWNNW